MVSAFLGYGRAMWSLAALWLFLDILCQGALLVMQATQTGAPVPELLDRGYIALGFLLWR